MVKLYGRTAVVFLCLAVASLLILTGCGNKVQATPPEVGLVPPSVDGGIPGDDAGAPNLPKLVAYMHLTGGCQQATTDALEKAQKDYAGKVIFEMVDFGDNGEGTRRWKDSGIGCMALVFGESHMAAWEQDGKLKVVDFRTPPGFNWTFEDLDQALTAFADGKLRQPTAEEAKNVQRLTPAAIEAKGQAVQDDDGKEVGQLLICNKIIVEVANPVGDMSPSARVKAAAKAIAEWTSEPYKPSEMRMTKADGNIVLMAGERVLLTATQADAEAAGKPLSKLAAGWHKGIRCAIVTANSGGNGCCE